MNKYEVCIVDYRDIKGNIHIYAPNRQKAFDIAHDYIYNWQLAPAAILDVKVVEYNTKDYNPYLKCTQPNWAKLVMNTSKMCTELLLLDDNNVMTVKFIIDNLRNLNQYAKEAIKQNDRKFKQKYIAELDDYAVVHEAPPDYLFSRDDLNDVMMNLRDACLELKLSLPNISFVDELMETIDILYIDYASKVVYNYKR